MRVYCNHDMQRVNAQGVAAEALGGTEWGIRIVLGWSLFGVIFLSAATYAVCGKTCCGMVDSQSCTFATVSVRTSDWPRPHGMCLINLKTTLWTRTSIRPTRLRYMVEF